MMRIMRRMMKRAMRRLIIDHRMSFFCLLPMVFVEAERLIFVCVSRE